MEAADDVDDAEAKSKVTYFSPFLLTVYTLCLFRFRFHFRLLSFLFCVLLLSFGLLPLSREGRAASW